MESPGVWRDARSATFEQRSAPPPPLAAAYCLERSYSWSLLHFYGSRIRHVFEHIWRGSIVQCALHIHQRVRIRSQINEIRSYCLFLCRDFCAEGKDAVAQDRKQKRGKIAQVARIFTWCANLIKTNDILDLKLGFVKAGQSEGFPEEEPSILVSSPACRPSNVFGTFWNFWYLHTTWYLFCSCIPVYFYYLLVHFETFDTCTLTCL